MSNRWRPHSLDPTVSPHCIIAVRRSLNTAAVANAPCHSMSSRLKKDRTRLSLFVPLSLNGVARPSALIRQL